MGKGSHSTRQQGEDSVPVRTPMSQLCTDGPLLLHYRRFQWNDHVQRHLEARLEHVPVDEVPEVRSAAGDILPLLVFDKERKAYKLRWHRADGYEFSTFRLGSHGLAEYSQAERDVLGSVDVLRAGLGSPPDARASSTRLAPRVHDTATTPHHVVGKVVTFC